MAALLLGIPIKILEPILIPIENNLEAKGKWKHAQRLRKIQRYLRGIGPDVIDNITRTIEAEISLHEIAQRETFLKDECQRLYEKAGYGPLSGQRKQLFDSWLRELRDLNEEYWRQERQTRRLEYMSYTGPLTRAYRSTRRDPERHLQGWSRKECASDGGCCGRACGCCERPRSTRSRCFGHCTISCGCCQRNRGFEIKRGSYNHQLSQVALQHLKIGDYHRHKLVRAYVWGM